MEMRRNIEERLNHAQQRQAVFEQENGSKALWWAGYIHACEAILEDITDAGCREFEAERRV